MLTKKTKSELRALCKERNIRGVSGLNKLALVERLTLKEIAPNLTPAAVTATPTAATSTSATATSTSAAMTSTPAAVTATPATMTSTPAAMTATPATMTATPAAAAAIRAHIEQTNDPQIVLLRKKEVIQWLLSDLSFLPEIQKKNKTSDEIKYKYLEDKWGQAVMRDRRPDLKLDKQWTNKFGEYICEELYRLQGKDVSKPAKKYNYQPDSETADFILEAKAGTFHTSGTAGEKILGCPFKYAEIPLLYNKPLKIVCMGGAERACRENYGNLPGSKCSPVKNKFLAFFRENQIEYVGASDLLKALSL